MKPTHLRIGDLVQVRPWEEIRATLDAQGTLGGMPFMPEILPYCGQVFPVWRLVHKACSEGGAMRELDQTVYIGGMRCDGSAHDGCQKCCRFFWHDAWLRKVDAATAPGVNAAALVPNGVVPPLMTRTQDGRYFCQSTELVRSSKHIPRWDPRHCWREFRSKNYPFKTFLRSLIIPVWLRLRMLIEGEHVYRLRGMLDKTPVENLNLQPGEWVEVKSREEIAATLDKHGRNRGLEFAPFLMNLFGHRFRVLRRIDHIVLETNGKMGTLKNTVLLDQCTCDSFCRLGSCPRDLYHFWHEIWLRRVSGPKE
jgi:hypothetical protein